MSAQRAIALPGQQPLRISLAATFPRMRALAWDKDILYVSRGYDLLRAKVTNPTGNLKWEFVGRFRPPGWRRLTVRSRLASRLGRDGFHALAVLPSGHIVAAVAGAIVTLAPGATEFEVSHRITRGTRPLHIAATPDGRLFWGEYFDNPQRDSVHVYASHDQGATWQVAYTFPKGAIRHVHNIVCDEFADCVWILTGDKGPECRILRASRDFRHVETVLSGHQQARAVTAVPARDGIFFASDTPIESNHVYFLDRRSELERLAELSSSSIYGCRVGEAIFFSTMAEPSKVNEQRKVALYGSADGLGWNQIRSWKKDRWPMRFFQYGNVFLPDGQNTSGMLALTTMAVNPGDQETSLWSLT